MDKAALLAGGADVEALSYSRASSDKKKQGKSVRDQDRLNESEIERYGWTAGEAFRDNDRSGSRYARREREDYLRLLEAIESGRGDVLVMWEIARGQRDLEVYVQLRSLCERVGLFFWMVGGTLYDLRVRADRLTLNMLATFAEDQAEGIHEGIQRGIDGAALDGRPHGQTAYGYTRIYHPRTRALVAQNPDTEIRVAEAEDGTRTEYTAAGVVRMIFTKLSEGVSLGSIMRELNTRAIPTPRGARRWEIKTIRRIAMNPSYIGKRVLRGEHETDAIWDGLVDDDLFWAVQRLLTRPERKSSRSNRAMWLQSHIAQCGLCDGPVRTKTRRKERREPVYDCRDRRCVWIEVEVLDRYVESVLVAWMSRDDVYDLLQAAANTSDKEMAQALAEVDRLKTELKSWHDAARAGTVSPAMAGDAEKGLKQRIAAAQQRADDATVPPMLRGMLGPDAAVRWHAADLEVKREILRTVATIHIHPATNPDGTTDRHATTDNVVIGGLLGGQTIPLAS